MGLLQILLIIISIASFSQKDYLAHIQTQPRALTKLAVHEMPMNDRYGVASVNEVFKENILLTIAYMRGLVKHDNQINWAQVNKPFHYEFVLKPHENFAFHDDVLPQYQGKVTYTTHAHFDAQEGFISDGYLFGDGVCHAASLMAWVAKDAGLGVIAPTTHNFAIIPDIPKSDGVAIYDSPGETNSSALQNLYITNTKNNPVIFAFDYHDNTLTFTINKFN